MIIHSISPMITKATLQDIPALNILINSAYRGESYKKGWTTEANLLEGKRTTEEELTETIQDSKNTILKFTENDQIIGLMDQELKAAKQYQDTLSGAIEGYSKIFDQMSQAQQMQGGKGGKPQGAPNKGAMGGMAPAGGNGGVS